MVEQITYLAPSTPVWVYVVQMLSLVLTVAIPVLILVVLWKAVRWFSRTKQ